MTKNYLHQSIGECILLYLMHQSEVNSVNWMPKSSIHIMFREKDLICGSDDMVSPKYSFYFSCLPALINELFQETNNIDNSLVSNNDSNLGRQRSLVAE